PDDRWILTAGAGYDRTARLWGAANGEALRRFEGHTGPVLEVAFSPDGRRVLTGSLDQAVRIWDRATGKTIRVFGGHATLVHFVAFSPEPAQALEVILHLAPKEIPDAVRAAVGHDDPTLRSFAIIALARMEANESEDLMQEALRLDPSAEVRRTALEVLVERQASGRASPEARRTLAELLRQVAAQDPVAELRSQAARELAQI
ncbi:MAG: HEAT repeat domain-containing protein, partial [Planctomycetota bacterium]